MKTLALTRKNSIPSIFNEFEDMLNLNNWPTFWHSSVTPRSKYVPNWRDSKDKKSYNLEIETPRFNKDEITAKIEDGYLVVEGKHKDEYSEYSINESIWLPEDARLDKIQAKLNNGILTINIEKQEKTKPKLIDVKVE